LRQPFRHPFGAAKTTISAHNIKLFFHSWLFDIKIYNTIIKSEISNLSLSVILKSLQ
jgi:hypothetical protein